MPINLRSLANAVRNSVRVLQKFRTGVTRSAGPHTPAPARQAAPGPHGVYPGDFAGAASIRYAPQPDGSPDPGEIVWTWVPYEEDHTRGKDRPVLLVGKSGQHLLGVMLTSRDHGHAGNGSGEYVDIGTGSWDRQQRPSEANLRRILQISPDAIRREGAVLDRKRFDLVAAGIRRRHGWK
ncbi:type II toxin-antitoxin system PemK/MazF family toxin [Pseudarthrobacter sp. SSS035]|uniref:type II toxin-antitoxin system PemK/MazF family toxin n=1 Tax=Pseudarthrobacter sp. SSS035 TaxID=2931399 RepID=UPI00200CED9C|nr:type II toxin-antitoxin system PemK/MazF family toxin [Pseudarthrobacter sp. SSS035]